MASISKKPAKKIYDQKYKESYHEEWPCISKSRKGELHAFCTTCSRDFSVNHGGSNDVKRHIISATHKDLSKVRSTSQSIAGFFKKPDEEDKIIKAEMLFTGFLVEHNLNIASSDHAGPLFRRMFPDSNIAAKYGCARTKTSAIIDVMSKDTASNIASAARNNPFSLSTDGSNDGGSEQLYPVLLTYFDENKGKVVNGLLSLPATDISSTGENTLGQ